MCQASTAAKLGGRSCSIVQAVWDGGAPGMLSLAPKRGCAGDCRRQEQRTGRDLQAKLRMAHFAPLPWQHRQLWQGPSAKTMLSMMDAVTADMVRLEKHWSDLFREGCSWWLPDHQMCSKYLWQRSVF